MELARRRSRKGRAGLRTPSEPWPSLEAVSFSLLLYGIIIDMIIDILTVDRSEGSLSTVTISPKYQVVIPKAIREKLKLRPGQKVEAIAYAGRIELIPVRPAKELRGFLEGLDTRVHRDDDRV